MPRPALVPLALLLAATAPAEDLRDVASRLVAEARRAAFAKDAAYEERTFTPDYATYGLQGQRFSRAQVIAERRQLAPLLDLKTADFRLLKIAAYRNGMILTVQTHTVGVVRDPRTRRPHALVADGVRDDGWIRTPKGWRMRTQRIRSYALAIDGKRRKG